MGAGLIVLFVAWFFLIGFYADQPGKFFHKGRNAVWLESTWVKDPEKRDNTDELVKTLEKQGINTVFVHAGPIEQDGSIDNDNYTALAKFLESAKALNEDINYQAWLGQIRGKIELDDPKVREEISKTVMTLTEIMGFDGVHFDIEPVWDEDAGFVKMLAEVRSKISNEKTISVALAEFIPQIVLDTWGRFRKFENHNSEVIYENVAQYADQIVVMVYDTDIDDPWFYRWFIAEQTIRLTKLMDEDTTLLVGIPAYDEVKEGFNPEAENVENAVNGVLRGLNNVRSRESSFEGVAIYRFDEMDEAEWNAYFDLWVK